MTRFSFFLAGIFFATMVLVVAEAAATPSFSSLGDLLGVEVNPVARIVVIASITILAALLYPVVVTRGLRRRRAEKLTRARLAEYAALDEVFEWEELEDTIVDCFMYVHAVCDKDNPMEAAKWMSERYRQDERGPQLERLAEGKPRRIPAIHDLGSIRPILFVPRSSEANGFEGSRIVVVISASIGECLSRGENGELFERGGRPQNVERVWWFALEDGQWKVDLIEEVSRVNEYVDFALLDCSPEPFQTVENQAA